VPVNLQSSTRPQIIYCRCDCKWRRQRWRYKLASPVRLRYRAALYGASSFCLWFVIWILSIDSFKCMLFRLLIFANYFCDIYGVYEYDTIVKFAIFINGSELPSRVHGGAFSCTGSLRGAWACACQTGRLQSARSLNALPARRKYGGCR